MKLDRGGTLNQVPVVVYRMYESLIRVFKKRVFEKWYHATTFIFDFSTTGNFVVWSKGSDSILVLRFVRISQSTCYTTTTKVR